MGAILFLLEPNSLINWHPRPRFLYFSCAVERKHIYCKFKPGSRMFRVPEVILHSPHPKFFSLTPDCTCVGEHLPQGASNMSLSWHPSCEFQKYKLARVGRRLGRFFGQPFILQFYFSIHLAKRVSLSRSFSSFLILVSFPLPDPTVSSVTSLRVSYPLMFLYLLSSLHYISYFWILGQEWK